MSWSTIKNFGKIKYFNISYVVLIIVPLLANTLEMINEKWAYQWTVPFTVKSLYFASILYAIAIAIYQYRCPANIKDYDNLQDYIAKNLEQFENKAPDLKLNIVLANLSKETQGATYNEIIELSSKSIMETDDKEKIKVKAELDEKLNMVYSSSIQTHLTTTFTAENTQEKISYWASGILYIAGSLIIFILLIIRTIIVFNN